MAVKYLTIKAGETGVIKANAKITSLVVTGSAQADSTCIELPPPEPLSCFSIEWSVDNNTVEASAWDFDDPNFALVGVGVGDTFYESSSYIDAAGGPVSGISALQLFIQTTIPIGVMQFVSLTTTSSTGDRSVKELAFLAPLSIGTKIYMKWQGTGLSNGAFIYAAECADCCGESES